MRDEHQPVDIYSSCPAEFYPGYFSQNTAWLKDNLGLDVQVVCYQRSRLAIQPANSKIHGDSLCAVGISMVDRRYYID